MPDTQFSCAKCGANSCTSADKAFPKGCMSIKAEEDGALEAALAEYNTHPEIMAVARAAAAVEAEFYCKAPRAEEIVHFAKKMDYKKIGIATCGGLIEEARIFGKILEASGLIPCGVACKTGRIDKTNIGIPEEGKVKPGGFEAMCNPVLQAKLLNEEGTDLNVIIGLCVGHDCLFSMYSKAPVTTLIAKDRVLAHNPAGALYTATNYYKHLLDLE